jgi:hypothetical protein
VTAESTGFPQSPYALQVAFADAQKAYTEAGDVAANDEQVRTADRLQGCWQFLDGTRATQKAVVETYSHVTTARDAFKRVEPEAGREAANAVDTRSRRAATRYRSLSSGSTVEEATAVSAISETEYQNKLVQFEADVGVFEDLRGILPDFAEGIRLLKLARIEFERDGRDVSRADQLADDATDMLGGVTEELDSMVDNAGEDTTLVPVLKSLRSVASNKAEAASDLD